jgi:hypothetical protein
MEMDIDQEPSKQVDWLEPVSTEPRIHVIRGYHLMHNNPLLENSFYFDKSMFLRKNGADICAIQGSHRIIY